MAPRHWSHLHSLLQSPADPGDDRHGTVCALRLPAQALCIAAGPPEERCQHGPAAFARYECSRGCPHRRGFFHHHPLIFSRRTSSPRHHHGAVKYRLPRCHRELRHHDRQGAGSAAGSLFHPSDIEVRNAGARGCLASVSNIRAGRGVVAKSVRAQINLRSARPVVLRPRRATTGGCETGGRPGFGCARRCQSPATSASSWSAHRPQPSWKPIFSWLSRSATVQWRTRAV
jgi:hypothetical protein